MNNIDNITHGFPNRFVWNREKYYAADMAGIFDNERVELINGEILLEQPKIPLNFCLIDRVSELLRSAFGRDYCVRCRSCVSFDDINEPCTDIAVITGPWYKYDDHNPYPEEILLIVEIADVSLDFDRFKIKLYASATIPEYWIVNLKETQLEVYRNPIGESYSEITIYKPGDIVKPIYASEKGLSIEDFLD